MKKTWLALICVLSLLLTAAGSAAAAPETCGLEADTTLPLPDVVSEAHKITRRFFRNTFEFTFRSPFINDDRFLVMNSENYTGGRNRAQTFLYNLATDEAELINMSLLNPVFRGQYLYFTENYRFCDRMPLKTDLVRLDLETGEKTTIRSLAEGGFGDDIGLCGPYLAWRELNPDKDGGQKVKYENQVFREITAKLVIYDLDQEKIIYSRGDTLIGHPLTSLRILDDATVFEIVRAEDGGYIGELRSFLDGNVLCRVPVPLFSGVDYSNHMLVFDKSNQELSVIDIRDGRELFSASDEILIRDFIIMKRRYLLYSGYSDLVAVDLTDGSEIYHSKLENKQLIKERREERYRYPTHFNADETRSRVMFNMEGGLERTQYNVLWTFE